MRAYYVYKNPIGKKMPKRMTLDINFSNLINSPYITLFFFIKLYGRAYAYNDPESDIELDDNVIEIIRLDDESQLYFGYDFDNENDAFFFSYNSKRIFQAIDTRTDNKNVSFGHWIPVTLSAFREYNTSLTLNMVTASIKYLQLGLCSEDAYFYPRIEITQFSITRQWIGLLSDIRIYDQFFMKVLNVLMIIILF